MLLKSEKNVMHLKKKKSWAKEETNTYSITLYIDEIGEIKQYFRGKYIGGKL